MARREFAIDLDFKPLLEAAGRLDSLSAEQIAAAAVESVNEIAALTYDTARDRMTRNINLEEGYVKRKMRVDLATRGNPSATITAFGGRSNLTVLGRYDARPVLVKAKNPKAGPSRIPGVPLGSKQAGVTVQVLKNQTNTDFVPRGFLLPLRRGREAGGNGVGVFARRKDGSLKHRYGPSVYQLFAFQAERITDEIGEAFDDDLADRVNALILKALE